MAEVIGVGQCSLDLLGTVDRWPQADSKIELPELVLQGGGPVATAMVTLSRLGIRSAIQGAVGDDDAGRQIRAGLELEEVDCGGLITQEGRRSQSAFIAVEPRTARRTIFWHRGDAQIRAEQLDAETIRRSRVLHLDGLHLDVALHAARLARAEGVLTVLDGGTLRPGMKRLLPFIDHAVVSESFSEVLSGGDPLRTCDQLLGFGVTAATVTLGSRGSFTKLSSGHVYTQPAFKVEVVDTTGCGDVFHGAYIFGLLKGWPWPYLLAFAAACAALKTRAIGGRTGIPVLEAAVSFLMSPGVVLPQRGDQS